MYFDRKRKNELNFNFLTAHHTVFCFVFYINSYALQLNKNKRTCIKGDVNTTSAKHFAMISPEVAFSFDV